MDKLDIIELNKERMNVALSIASHTLTSISKSKYDEMNAKMRILENNPEGDRSALVDIENKIIECAIKVSTDKIRNASETLVKDLQLEFDVIGYLDLDKALDDVIEFSTVNNMDYMRYTDISKLVSHHIKFDDDTQEMRLLVDLKLTTSDGNRNVNLDIKTDRIQIYDKVELKLSNSILDEIYTYIDNRIERIRIRKEYSKYKLVNVDHIVEDIKCKILIDQANGLYSNHLEIVEVVILDKFDTIIKLKN